MWANDGDAVFIREFTLIRRDHLPEEPLHDSSQKPEDPVSACSENTALNVDYHSGESQWWIPPVSFPISDLNIMFQISFLYNYNKKLNGDVR